jgi:hypothetical protein
MPELITHDREITEQQKQPVMPRRVVAMPSLMRLVDARGIGVGFRDGEVRVIRPRANIWIGGTGSPAFGRGCGRRLISVWVEQTVVEPQPIFRIDIPRNARDIRRHLKSRHWACSNTHKRWRRTFVVPLLGGEREKPVYAKGVANFLLPCKSDDGNSTGLRGGNHNPKFREVLDQV